MDLAGRRVLVTGASGFLGRHLAAALPDATLVVRSPLEGPKVVRLDLATGDVPGLVRDVRPEVVFHLAADARPGAPIEDEPAMEALHVAATLALARAAAGARFVTVSTSDVYGPLPSPHDADGPVDPQTPYARSKAKADARLLAEPELDVVILRPYHVYGPGQGERQFVASLVRACVEDRPFAMSDGRQRRDFVFVDDVVRALLAAAVAPGARGRVVDVCTGVPTAVLDVALAVKRAAGCTVGGPVPGALPRRRGEPEDHFGDPAPAASLLGWRPAVDLAEGVARTVAAARVAK